MVPLAGRPEHGAVEQLRGPRRHPRPRSHGEHGRGDRGRRRQPRGLRGHQQSGSASGPTAYTAIHRGGQQSGKLQLTDTKNYDGYTIGQFLQSYIGRYT